MILLSLIDLCVAGGAVASVVIALG